MRFPFVQEMIVSFAAVLGICGAALAADMPTKAPPFEPAPAIPGWTFSLTP